MNTLKVSHEYLWFRFLLEDNIPISESRAMCAQRDFGKHPDGYGFYNFKCEYDGETKTYQARWACQDNTGD
jgi:hypothetical protein